jgi:ABC-type transport system substrate-binding protein
VDKISRKTRKPERENSLAGNYWDKVTSNRVARRRLLRSGAALSVGAAALALVGCGDDDSGGGDAGGGGGAAATSAPSGAAGGTTGTAVGNPPEGTFSASEGDPVLGGRYRQVLAQSVNFNVLTNWRSGNGLSGKYIYDRPINSREDSRGFVLEALESIEQPDDLTVVMKLRPGMVYQDVAPVNARPVRASDIVATQNSIIGLEDAFDKTFVDDFLESAEAPDDLTAIYHLKKPAAYLFGMQMLGGGNGQPIVPEETLDNLDTGTPVGSGPFQQVSARLNVNYLYEQNPTYWGRNLDVPLPFNGEVETKFIPDRAAVEAAWYGNDIDEWFPEGPTPYNTSVGRRSDAHHFEVLGFNNTNFSFNLYEERALPFRDERVRNAIWRVTDKQELLTRGYENGGVVTTGLLPAVLDPVYGVDPAVVAPFVKQDVAEARKLLEAANYDFDQVYGIAMRGAGDILESVAIVEQNNLAKAGIKTELQAFGTAGGSFFERLQRRDWDLMFETPPGNDKPGQMLRVQHSASWSSIYMGFGLNLTGEYPELDAIIEKSEETIDLEENIRLVKEAQVLAMSHYSAAYLVVSHFTHLGLGPRVHNYELTSAQPALRHLMWVTD